MSVSDDTLQLCKICKDVIVKNPKKHCGQHYVDEMMKKKRNLKKLHINIFTQKYQRKSDAENIK